MCFSKKLICIVTMMMFALQSLAFTACAGSSTAVDFDIVVGNNGEVSIKGLTNETDSTDAETNPHKTYNLTEAGILFNNNAAVLNDAPTYTQVAVPSWSTKFGPTIKLGRYSHSYWIIERSISNTDKFKVSTAFKKNDTAHSLSIFQDGGNGVEFSTSGRKIKLGNKDTGLTWELDHWYKLELYFSRTSAAADDGVVVMYLTDLDAEDGPVTYRREAYDSWTSVRNKFHPLVGRSWSASGTDIEWAYWYVDNVADDEVFTSNNSFDANYIEGHYYTTDGFTSSGSWKLLDEDTGHFKLPKAFPTSGEVSFDIYDSGSAARTLSFSAYDEETGNWGSPQDIVKMNDDGSISVCNLDEIEGACEKEFVSIRDDATWVPSKEYKTNIRIDLDSEFVCEINGSDASCYPAIVTITDMETGISHSVGVNIPLNITDIDGIGVTRVRTEEVYDFTTLGSEGIADLITAGEISIVNEVPTAWSIDNNGLKLSVSSDRNIADGTHVNLFQWDREEDYTAIVKVDANANNGENNNSSGQWTIHTGFAIHEDANNYLIFGVGSRQGGYIVHQSKINGTLDFTGSSGSGLASTMIGSTIQDQGDVWLKVEKIDNVYNCSYSLDGARYETIIENYRFDAENAKIGIYSGLDSGGSNRIEGLFKSLTFKKPESLTTSGDAYAMKRIVMNHSADTHMVVASEPFNTKKDVRLDVIPELTFDIAPYDVDDYSYGMTYFDGENDISVSVSPELYGNTVKLIPDSNLEPGKVYTIEVEKDGVTVFSSQFTTISDEIVYAQAVTENGSDLTTRQFVKLPTPSQPIMIAGTYDAEGTLINRAAHKSEETAYVGLETTVDKTGSVVADAISIETADTLRPLVVNDAPETITSAVLKDAYFDRSVPGRLVVKGKLTGAPENTEVFVLVYPDDGNINTTAAQERNLILTDTGISGATYYKKILTNAAGEFEFSAQTGAGAGAYKIAFGYSGCDSAVESPIIKNFDQTSIDSALSAVNAATTADDMFDALETNREVLDIALSLDELDAFDGYDDNIIHQDMCSRLAKYLIDNRPADGYTQVIDVTNKVKQIVPLCKFDYAHDNNDVASKKAILNDSDNRIAFGINTLDAMEVYDSLNDAGKNRVAERLTANDDNDFELFKKQFIQETLLSMVKNALLHSDLTPAFEKCYNSMASALTGIDYTTYVALDDKSSVNISIVKCDFTDIAALALVMNPLISKANTPSTPSYDSGSSGGTGGSFKPVIEEPTESKVETETVPEFKDMRGYDWAQEAVTELAKQKIISGKANGVFDPGGSVLREEFTKMLVLLFELSGSGNLNFADVSEDSWFYEYVEAAFANGIVNGASEQIFGTGNKILRQDMAVMIYRAAVKTGVIEGSSSNSYMFSDDASIDEYAREAVYALAELGVINGTGNGMFNPKGTATRAEAAKIIYEILKLKNA